MSEQVEDKTVELMDRAADAVEAFAVKLGQLSTEYGPEVGDAALWVARIDAGSGLFYGLIIFCMSIFLWFWVRPPLISKNREMNSLRIKENHRYSCPVEDMCYAFGYFIIPFFSGAFFILSIVMLSNIWRYVGIIEPQLWIAKRVLGL